MIYGEKVNILYRIKYRTNRWSVAVKKFKMNKIFRNMFPKLFLNFQKCAKHAVHAVNQMLLYTIVI